MAKDPAFLFYPGDWLSGTMGMTFEEKGAYFELLMLQFNRGHMTSHMIGRSVGQLWVTVQDKFIMDKSGLWYNVRLEEEQIKRKNFVSTRKNNLSGENQYSKKQGHKGGHTTSRMENENEDRNEDGNENEKKGEIKNSENDFKGDLSDPNSLDVRIYDPYPESSGNRKGSVSTDLHTHTLNTAKGGLNGKVDFQRNLEGAFDDIILEKYAMAFGLSDSDVKSELTQFALKCESDPASYFHRDSGGLRTAFQYQLKQIKTTKKSTPKKQFKL